MTSDPMLIALAASRLAVMLDADGDHWSSLQYLNVSRTYAEESGDPAAVISAEMTFAGTYGYYGDRELECKHVAKAVELAQRAGYPSIAASALLWEADCEWGLGQRARARRLDREAFRYEKYFSPDARLHVAAQRGLSTDDPAHWRRRANEFLRIATEAKDDSAASSAICFMIRRELEQGHVDAAVRLVRELSHYTTSLTAAQRFDSAVISAMVERRTGHIDAALRDIRDAIALSEQERGRILGNGREAQEFLRGRLQAYQELVAILAAKHRPLDALAASDEAKGRTLLDILRSNHLSLDWAMSAGERRREQELRGRAANLRRTGAGREKLAQSRADIENFETAMTAKYPRAAPTWSSPVPLTDATLRGLLTEPELAIVEFMIADDQLITFVVTHGAGDAPHVVVRRTPIKAATLRKRIGAFVTSLSIADVDYMRTSRKLYDLLLAPIAPQLARARVVCIIPDGPLWQLPFESLMAPDRKFFVEHAAPFYAPSIAVYARMTETARRHNLARGTLFALADPAVGVVRDAPVSRLRAGEATPLPDAAREVETAARILGGKSAVYVGAAASRERFETEASGYRILHFATHGVLDNADPMYSHLVLAPSGKGDDGVLETWQLMRTKLNAELTVLSACNTARGGLREGEGVVGMSWALFIAGCPSTISAEWKIASAPTADLMIAFYRHWNALGNQPFAKTKALAAAQRAMLRRRGRRHPFFWAPFILVGVG